MRSTQLREHNLAEVMRLITSAEEPLARAGIAAATGLTKPTVSKLVEELIDAQLVVEEAPLAMRTGRPIVPLRPAQATLLGIGVHITSTRLLCIAMDLAGEIRFERSLPLAVADLPAAKTVDALGHLLGDVVLEAKEIPVVGVCVSVPGRVSPDGDEIHSAPNLGWEHVPLRGLLASLLHLDGVEITLENDNRLSVLTEVGRRSGESFLYVRGGTGIGGAVVLDGRVLDGEHGWAGEIGHANVVPGGALCRCGRRGCLEAYVSQYALRHQVGARPGVEYAPDAEDLVSELARQRPRDEVIELIGRPLGIAIASALNVLDLSTVVLSGYLAPIAGEVTPVVRSTVREHALAAEACEIVIERADGVERPALLGAAHAALSQVISRPDLWISKVNAKSGRSL